MGLDATIWARQQKTGNGYATAVLKYLADEVRQIDRKTGEKNMVWTLHGTHTTIAAGVEFSVPTVKRAMLRLRAAKLITWKPHPEKRGLLITLNPPAKEVSRSIRPRSNRPRSNRPRSSRPTYVAPIDLSGSSIRATPPHPPNKEPGIQRNTQGGKDSPPLPCDQQGADSRPLETVPTERQKLTEEDFKKIFAPVQGWLHKNLGSETRWPAALRLVGLTAESFIVTAPQELVDKYGMKLSLWIADGANWTGMARGRALILREIPPPPPPPWKPATGSCWICHARWTCIDRKCDHGWHTEQEVICENCITEARARWKREGEHRGLYPAAQPRASPG